jgi:phosphatidylglycerol lysyltransferase
MTSKFSLSEITIVKLISLLTAAMGIVNVMSAVTPSLSDRLKLLEQYSPFGVSHGGHLTSALAGSSMFWITTTRLWLL